MLSTLHKAHLFTNSTYSVSDFTTKLNIVSEMFLVMGLKLITLLSTFCFLWFVLTEIMKNVCFVVGVYNYVLGIIPVITNYVVNGIIGVTLFCSSVSLLICGVNTLFKRNFTSQNNIVTSL